MTSWNYQPPPPQGIPKTIFDDIEQIKGVVAKYFPIYNTQVHFDMVTMSCNVDQNNLEQNFESLRKELKTLSYIPLITKEKGEHLVHVVKSPPAKFRGPWLNIVLLIATIGTTIWAGATLWSSVFNTGSFLETENLANGALYFALPLMLILSIHEMAHYFAAKKHGVAASLPFFIPAPFILGTLGAFISIREPIPNKKALLDIGFAGPIAGFIVAIPVLCIGLVLSGDITAPAQTGTLQGGTMLIGTSALFESFMYMFGLGSGVSLHPLAFAGWVGFFVTALNLLPVGQLDGGHIARALLGEKSRWAGYGAISVMLVLGLLFSSSWLFFALLIMFMGMRHPPPLNEVTNLDNRRKAVGIAAALMLVLCFVPIPLDTVPVNYDFTFYAVEPGDNNTGNMTDVGHDYTRALPFMFASNSWGNQSDQFQIVNNGSMPLDLKFTITITSNISVISNATVWLSVSGDANASASPYFNTTLDIDQTLNLTLNMMFGPMPSRTVYNIDILETGYDWDSNMLETDNPDTHRMRATVIFV
jgi:membrane-associated protease RseP (regulator of RpoE activity)